MDCLPQIHVAAIHAEPGYRSAIPGAGVMCRPDERLFGAGAYRNSIGRDTVYAVAGWQPLRLGEVRIGAIAGIVTGYRPHAVPAAAAFISWGNVHFTAIPEVQGKTPWTVGISFSFSWQRAEGARP